MAHRCSINSSPVELSKFVEVSSQEPNWYMLGVHLGVPSSKLDVIERTHPKDFSRCLVELHKSLEKSSFTWEAIASSLEKMPNNDLADKIRTTYCVPSTATLESMSTETTPPSGYGVSSTDKVTIKSGPVVPQNFESLNEQLAISMANTKKALKKSKVRVEEVQDLACNPHLYGIPRLPQDQATIDAVFNQIMEKCSILNFKILKLIVKNFLKTNKNLQKEITSLDLAAEQFKTSVEMSDLAGRIKATQTTAHTGCIPVKLKVQAFWEQFTFKQFEAVMNDIFKTLYEILSHITVEKGCIFVNWIIPAGVNYRKLLPTLSPEFLRIIGVIYLHIGDDVIYKKGCDTLEAARQQAVELKNTRAIKLLEAVSCSPEAVQGVTGNVKREIPSSVNRSGVAHTESTVSSNKEEKHSSCKKKENMQPALQQNNSRQKRKTSTADAERQKGKMQAPAGITNLTDDFWTDRVRHCGVIVEDVHYSFGGCKITDDDHKSSMIDIFNFMPATKQIKSSKPNGDVPEAMMFSSCCSIGRDIYHFGGSCKPDKCFHNSLAKLNTNTLTWKQVIPSNDDYSTGPMKKHGCGMIAIQVEEKNRLLVIGGLGEKDDRLLASDKADYICPKQKLEVCYTNEVWSNSACIPPPPGLEQRAAWFRHKTVGDPFPPRAFFSANTLPNNRGVIFGGQVVVDGNFERSDDIYIATVDKDEIDFEKAIKPSPNTPWPTKRYHHATTVITSLSNLTHKEISHLVVIGGYNDKIVADCWIMNMDRMTWSMIDLPDNVTHRQKHTISSVSFSPSIVWLIVRGGCRKGSDPVPIPDNFCLVKLVFDQKTAQWSRVTILNSAEISSKQYRQFLLESFVEVRQATARKEHVSMSLSPSKKWEDVVPRLQEAEEHIHEIQRHKTSLEEELQRIQKESEKEKSKIMEQKHEMLKRKDERIKQLEKNVKQLKDSVEENEKTFKALLDKVTREAKDKVVAKEREIQDLQQQISSVEENNFLTLQATLKKHKQETQDKDSLIKTMNLKVFNLSENVSSTKKAVEELQLENSTLKQSMQNYESESKQTLQELKKKEEEISSKIQVIEILKQNLVKQKIENEEFIAKTNHFHSEELKKKINEIDNLYTQLETKELEMSEVVQNLQQAKQQLEEVQSKNQDLQKEKDDLASKKPQWMVIEEEVEVTEDIVGKGSYGEVKIASFRGTKVAAKNLHDIIMSDYNSKLFNREMDMCSKLHHPNIVQFIAATDGNTPVLLYELMETSLHDRMARMQKNQLTQKEILDISTDVLLALAYLHAWKPDPIIHRDISSSNVLMECCGENKWRSKLSDFGSANLQRYTATRQPGNPHYAAPEAYYPDSHTTSMDIYSLGVLIIEMVNHEPPKMQQDREKQVNSMGWTEMGAILINCIAEDHKIRPRASGLLQEVATLSGQIETID